MSGGGGGPRSTNVKQESGPPPEFIPFFERLFKRAEGASNQVPAQGFQGPLRAAVDPLQLEALQQQETFARGLDPNLGQGLISNAQATARGDFLSPDSNPFLESTAQAATRPIEDNFSRALQQIQSQAIQAGAFGGARSDLAGVELAREAQRNISDTRAKLFNENFARERGFQFQAPQLLEAGVRFGQLPSALLSEVGGSRRAFEQEGISEDIARFEESISAPFRPLFPLASILAQTDVGTQGGSVVTQPGGASSGAQAFGGALGGASAGAGISGALGANQNQQLIATLLAALGGGASGF